MSGGSNQQPVIHKSLTLPIVLNQAEFDIVHFRLLEAFADYMANMHYRLQKQIEVKSKFSQVGKILLIIQECYDLFQGN